MTTQDTQKAKKAKQPTQAIQPAKLSPEARTAANKARHMAKAQQAKGKEKPVTAGLKRAERRAEKREAIAAHEKEMLDKDLAYLQRQLPTFYERAHYWLTRQELRNICQGINTVHKAIKEGRCPPDSFVYGARSLAGAFLWHYAGQDALFWGTLNEAIERRISEGVAHGSSL